VNLGELKKAARAKAQSGSLDEAFLLFAAGGILEPCDLDCALRAADCAATLLDAGAAAPLYRAIARYALRSGHPLPALVCARVLSQAGVDASDLLAAFVDRYRAGAPGLGGPEAARLSVPNADTSVPTMPRQSVDQMLDQLESKLAGFSNFPRSVHPVPLLSQLSGEALSRVLATMLVKRVPEGTFVVKQGEPGESFYFVASGNLRVVMETPAGERNPLATLTENALFGEMSLLRAEPRSASVVALSDVDLLEFTKKSLQALSKELASVQEALQSFTQSRLLTNLMAQNPLFRPFSPGQRKELLRRFTRHEVGANEVVIAEGEVGQGLFLVIDGDLIVSTGGADVARLGSGDVFGEMALVRQAPTSATVTAAKPTSLLFLARENVEAMIAGIPQIREYLEGLTANRELHNQLSSEPFSALEDEDVIILV
jgi:cAMP-dependent protein kinase regulator